MSIPGHAVAARAVLREQRGAASEVRRLARRERHRIGLEQIGGEAMGDACDLLGFALGGNHTPELGCSRNQLSARRRGWQGLKELGRASCRERVCQYV